MSKKIALIGNPNSGKTTLFNQLTGIRQQTGNWPGVTGDRLQGRGKLSQGNGLFFDLPGVYSFNAASPDEQTAMDILLNREYDLVVNIIDAVALERSLYLTYHLIEMKIPMILVVNMMDKARRRKINIDFQGLSKKLGIPVVGISALNRRDVEKLRDYIAYNSEIKPISKTVVEYPLYLEKAVSELETYLHEMAQITGAHTRWLACRILENDPWFQEKAILTGSLDREEIDYIISQAAAKGKETSLDSVITESVYEEITKLTSQFISQPKTTSMSDIIDKIALNKYLGIPLFFGIMSLVFWFVLSVGGAASHLFDAFARAFFIDGSSYLFQALGFSDVAIVIISRGFGTGLQTIMVFIPLVFTLYFALAILEDSGYMPRAAFLMDRFLSFLGLPGKAVIPLVLGSGCSIPAMLATRSLDSVRDRFFTIFMTPFMSCGAKLPVYIIFASAFFPEYQWLVIISLYVTGIALGVVSSIVFKKTLFPGIPSGSIMEVPSYRVPSLKHVLLISRGRLKLFIVKAGKIIIIMASLLSIADSINIKGEVASDKPGTSILALAGKTIVPVFAPLGIREENWPAAVSVISGLATKEAVIGSLNTLYSMADGGKARSAATISEAWERTKASFKANLKHMIHNKPFLNKPVHTAELLNKHFTGGTFQVYAYLLFILLYFPCLASMAVMFKIMGPALSILSATYLTFLAWSVSTLFYQVTTGHQLQWILASLAMVLFIISLLYYFGKSIQTKQENSRWIN